MMQSSFTVNEPRHEKTNNVVSKQVRHIRVEQALKKTRGWKFRGRNPCTIRVAKIKALISFAVTAKLICVFGFAYADRWFSHEVAQMKAYRR